MLTLRYGSTGTDVEILQLALSRSGFYSGEMDGDFGPGTQNSVRRFQASFSLEPDGVIGPITSAALEPFITGCFVSSVKSGDTIYRIAKRYGTTVAAIEAANPDIDPNELAVGEDITIPYGFDLVPTNMRYSPTLTDIIIKGLEMRYPFMRSEIYGYSVLGHPLRVIGFGTGDREVMFNASHHANEWITTPLVLKFAETFLSKYVDGGTMYGRSCKYLFERVKLFIAPLVNPDGVALVNGGIDIFSKQYAEVKRIAADYPLVRFPEGWKANIEGTDLNLNYPAGWAEAQKIKFAQGYNSPAPRDYVGTAPLSAPESRALHDFTLAHNFLLTVSYHTQGREIYWKYNEIEPERGYAIGEEMAKVSGYMLADVPPESANAGYKDWFIKQYRLPAYTVEAGSGDNPLPLKQFDEIFSDNIGIMITAMESA
ncbi:MAG: peptidoglycan-binding protein [Clostridia bacterium]|nr:peptidoglycan-binding protein [Clostridia bacterium]